MGNNDRAAIIGKGDVHLESANGTKLVLKSVRHVEALRLNKFFQLDCLMQMGILVDLEMDSINSPSAAW